jgi:hypothetical protein
MRQEEVEEHVTTSADSKFLLVRTTLLNEALIETCRYRHGFLNKRMQDSRDCRLTGFMLASLTSEVDLDLATS